MKQPKSKRSKIISLLLTTDLSIDIIALNCDCLISYVKRIAKSIGGAI